MHIKTNLEPVAVIGLGYVGIQLAIAFDKKVEVIGFDTNLKRINNFQNGIDDTQVVGDYAIKESRILFTCDNNCLCDANTFVIAVPTPVDSNNEPDLLPLKVACKIVGKHVKEGTTVVFESTVYPGVTEEICLPIIEQVSGLSGGKDFFIGYSPERLSPGDRDHSLDNVAKIVSGINRASREKIKELYCLVINSNLICTVDDIKVAEAAKLLENTQRDVLIALMNECAIIFNKLNVNIDEVISAASTKWNFSSVYPGLVGGHCIGVDPYYLISLSNKLGYQPKLVSASRLVNEYMGTYVAEQLKDLLRVSKGKKVLVYGITYKEDVSDIRNTKVAQLVSTLLEWDMNVFVSDYLADDDEVKSKYNIQLCSDNDVGELDAIIFAVKHSEYSKIDLKLLKNKYRNKPYILFDLYHIFDEQYAKENGYLYWTL